jgi:hypothetical protein
MDSILSRNGVSWNPGAVQEATAVYARLDLDPVRESMERATSAMLVAGGVKPAADVAELKARTAKR